MRYLLILHGVTARDLRRDEFERTATEAGELITGEVLADPQLAVILPGPANSSDRTIDAYYLVDVDTRDRAVELAALLPDAHTICRSVEIRAVMHTTAADF